MLTATVDQLDRGDAPLAATQLGATDVAEYVEGRFSLAAADVIETACWESPEQMCEVVSAIQFAEDASKFDELSEPVELSDCSSHLTERLLATAPRAIERRRRRAMKLPDVVAQGFNGQSVVPPVVQAAGQSNAQSYTLLPPIKQRPAIGLSRRGPADFQLLLAAAAIVLLLAGGAIGYWMSRGATNPHRVPVAHDDQPAPAAPKQGSDDPRPPANRIVTPLPGAGGNRGSPDAIEPPPAPQIVEISPLHRSPRQHAVPSPSLSMRKTATIDSPIGAVLVDVDASGRLRLARGAYSLGEPLRLISLAESWSRIEIPDVGSLILAGPSELALASWGDGVLEIDLRYGMLGIERLPAGKPIRFRAGSVQWLARGADNYSSLAVFHDPQSPSLVVPAGRVAVEDTEVLADQFVRLSGGAIQPQPLAARPAAASDDLATGWLAAPDEERRKKWHSQCGKLVDRLAIVDDVGVEMPLIFASTRDTRQAALLAEWNFAVADETARPAELWAVLGDRRELVRLAGARTLLAMRPGDERLAHAVRYVRLQMGDDVGARVAQWMRNKDQPGQIALPQAVELAEYMSHRELALRQLAVSLLERHAAPALARARRGPPDYNAAETAGKRAEGQRQWRALIRQLFAPQRTAPAALGAQRPPQLAPNAANANQP